MASIEDSFRTTLSSFKKRLTPKEQEDFSFSTLEDVRDVILRIQREQGSQKELRNMPRIRSFLEAMEQFGQVIEVFLNASEFVAFIWGPVKFVLLVASTWTHSFDTILDAYEQLGDHIPLLQQYKALFEHNPHMRRVLEMIYYDILEFHKCALRFFSDRSTLWRQVFRSVWKDFKTRFQHILDRLRLHGGLVQSQANLLHIQQYQLDRTRLLEDLDRLENNEGQNKCKDVLEWICGTNVKVDHETACEARREYPASGRWILQHPRLQDWKGADEPVSSILWLNGIPGAGKTILASVIVEDCLRDPSFSTSYFYCRHSDPAKNTCSAIFKAVLSQLICKCRDLVPFCHDKYLASGELTLISTNLAKQLLELLCHKISKQYIIIDGLDECDFGERKLVLAFFNLMIDRYEAKEPGKLRVLFVSQDENDIRKGLITAAEIALRPTDNADDIRSFVHRWSLHIQQKFELDEDQVNRLTDLTCFRAQGMFLFARLVMTNLFSQTSRLKLLEEVNPARFPEGLAEAYERIMTRIAQKSPPEWKIAQKLLGWMVCAKRALKWHEIQAAVSTDPVDQTVNFDELRLRVHIKDLCGSLIQVLPGDRIELVHSTAKFYITNTGRVRKPVIECSLTALCLQYLTFECFGLNIAEEKLQDSATKGYFVFQDYAIANWSHHFLAMVHAGPQLFAQDSETKDAMEELAFALEEFAENYGEDMSQELIEGPSEQACTAFKQCDFYPSLQLIWSHVHLHQQKDFDAKNAVSLKSLGVTLARNRKLLEDLTSSKDQLGPLQKDLTSFYGDQRFKCPKVACFFFHEGFTSAKSRDLHINRHDRPFRCTFPDCSVADFGLKSSKELENHQRLFHPTMDDIGVTFTTQKKSDAKTPHECHTCSKKFTRKFHLRSHIRTHNDERPFACSECGKAFTRSNDCKRHEKNHARR